MRGKNAQHCYNYALDILKNLDHMTYNTAQDCKEAAKASIERNLCFIDEFILVGFLIIIQYYYN